MILNPNLVDFVVECIRSRYDEKNSDFEYDYIQILKKFSSRVEGIRDAKEIKQTIHDICGNDPWFKSIKRDLLTSITKAEQCKNRKELEQFLKIKPR